MADNVMLVNLMINLALFVAAGLGVGRPRTWLRAAFILFSGSILLYGFGIVLLLAMGPSTGGEAAIYMMMYRMELLGLIVGVPLFASFGAGLCAGYAGLARWVRRRLDEQDDS